MTLDRRTLLKLAALGLLVPRPLVAAPTPSRRRFLFVFCNGGWDQAYAFAPLFGNPNVDMEADATTAVVNGIPFVDHAARPSVRAFFETWGHAACLLNGFEVRSIAHDKARRLLLTGTATAADDWGSIVAAASPEALTLPYLVASGPSFNRDLAEEAVLLGRAGQLGALLDGSSLDGGRPLTRLSPAASAALEARVRARVASAGAAAGAGREQRFTSKYDLSLDRIAQLRTIEQQLSFSADDTFAARVDTALTCFQLGASRSAIVQHGGSFGLGWDTHAGNSLQSWHFEELFADLLLLFDELAARPGTDGGTLSDEVTVVVLSEMGRHPQLNPSGGKDHWTFTSALLVGSGIRGGQAVGAYDDAVVGEPIDLASGETTPAGTALTSAHLGATLLTLADVDPTPWTGGAEPITAVMT